MRLVLDVNEGLRQEPGLPADSLADIFTAVWNVCLKAEEGWKVEVDRIQNSWLIVVPGADR